MNNLGYFDVHTHFLQCVDDGSDSIEETLRLIKKDYDEGIRNIILTPHLRLGMFETSVPDVEKQYKILENQLLSVFPDIKLYLGREFHANMDMIEIIDRCPEHFCLGNSNAILLEFSSMHNIMYMHQRIDELFMAGYQPIIAHAERYPALTEDIENFYDLKDKGALIQINADSISGEDGRKMKKFCKKLMKANLIDFVGSDGHNLTDRVPNMAAAVKQMNKVMGNEYTDRICMYNPMSILEQER